MRVITVIRDQVEIKKILKHSVKTGRSAPGLDPASLIKLKELILQEKGKGKTILITTHIMQFVEEMADEIVYLLEGDIYFKGSIQQLMANTQQTDFEHAIAAISIQTTDV